MITVKLFEVRDSMTCMPCFAFKCEASLVPTGGSTQFRDEYKYNEAETFLLRKLGYPKPPHHTVMFGKLSGGYAYADPNDHDYRTMSVAHRYVEDRWEELNSGDVIDVEFIMGITREPKKSERLSS